MISNIKVNKNFMFYVLFFVSVYTFFLGSIFIHNVFYITGDEGGFIETGKTLFFDYFIKGDFFNPIWRESLAHYGSNNPKVGSFILGIIESTGNLLFYDPVTRTSNIRQYIFYMRAVNTIFSVLSVLMLYLTIKNLRLKISGLLFVVFFIIHPVSRSFFIRLLPDVHMFFFLSFSVVFMSLCDTKNKLEFKLTVLSALFTGLALSCKLYSGFLIFMGLYVYIRKIAVEPLRRVITHTLLFFTVSGYVFYLTNPLMYTDAFFAIKEMTSSQIKISEVPMLRWENLTYLFLIPFYIFRLRNYYFDVLIFKYFDMDNFLSADSFQSMLILSSIVFVYLCVIIGIVICIKKKEYFMLFYFLFSNLYVVYPLIKTHIGWLQEKNFIVCIVPIIYMFCVGVQYAFLFFKDIYFRKIHPLKNL